jgi:hypothetical protein
MKRMLLILLCVGVIGTMSGCYVGSYPYPYYGGYGGADVSISVGRGWKRYGHYGHYHGYRYGAYSGWHRGGHPRWYR